MELDGVRFVHDLMNGFIDLFGGGNAGIAQRIIEDVLFADNFGLLQTVGKELPDHGRSGAQLIKSLIDHIFLLLYNYTITRLYDYTMFVPAANAFQARCIRCASTLPAAMEASLDSALSARETKTMGTLAPRMIPAFLAPPKREAALPMPLPTS